jgi:hypothetical protein
MGLKRARIASNGFCCAVSLTIIYRFLNLFSSSAPFINTVSPIVNSFSSIKTVQHLISGKSERLYQGILFIFHRFFCNRFAFASSVKSGIAAKGSALFLKELV